MSKLSGHLSGKQERPRASCALGSGRTCIAGHGICRVHTSSRPRRCGISSYVCDTYRKAEFAWSLSFGTTAVYIVTSLLIQSKASRTFLPQASGQHQKPRLLEFPLTGASSKHLTSNTMHRKNKIIGYTGATGASPILQIYKMGYCKEA